MTLTPVEIRHLKPSRAFVGGYDRDTIDGLLDEIVASFEDVWRERADMADKVEQLESDLVRYREIEGLLRTTLVSAEKAAVTLKEQARKEAELIVEEARSEARSICSGPTPTSSTILSRVPCPETSVTASRGNASVSARSRTTASFARPPSGGAATRTFHASPCRPTTRARAAPGATRKRRRVETASMQRSLASPSPRPEHERVERWAADGPRWDRAA